jgi:hypothetical protein
MKGGEGERRWRPNAWLRGLGGEYAGQGSSNSPRMEFTALGGTRSRRIRSKSLFLLVSRSTSWNMLGGGGIGRLSFVDRRLGGRGTGIVAGPAALVSLRYCRAGSWLSLCESEIGTNRTRDERELALTLWGPSTFSRQTGQVFAVFSHSWKKDGQWPASQGEEGNFTFTQSL